MRAPAVTTLVSAVGSTSQIQLDLSGLGYLARSGVDGSYGPVTTAAAKAFQNDRCIDTDGVTGSITWGELVGRVKLVQGKVGTTVDGIYGSGTLAKVQAWQAAHGLSADGIAGPITMGAMGIARKFTCGSGIVGNPFTASTTIACAPGTRFVADRTDGYVDGVRISIKLCAITGLKSTSEESNAGSAYYVSGANGDTLVNSRISGAIYGLYLRAQRSGVALSVNSSFRTMAHQTALYNAPHTPGAVAAPGYSNHQSGNAIDYATGGSVKSGATCSTRATASSAMYWYLSRNAAHHGIGQLTIEPWHFQPLSASSTCA